MISNTNKASQANIDVNNSESVYLNSFWVDQNNPSSSQVITEDKMMQEDVFIKPKDRNLENNSKKRRRKKNPIDVPKASVLPEGLSKREQKKLQYYLDFISNVQKENTKYKKNKAEQTVVPKSIKRKTRKLKHKQQKAQTCQQIEIVPENLKMELIGDNTPYDIEEKSLLYFDSSNHRQFKFNNIYSNYQKESVGHQVIGNKTTSLCRRMSDAEHSVLTEWTSSKENGWSGTLENSNRNKFKIDQNSAEYEQMKSSFYQSILEHTRTQQNNYRLKTETGDCSVSRNSRDVEMVINESHRCCDLNSMHIQNSNYFYRIYKDENDNVYRN